MAHYDIFAVIEEIDNFLNETEGEDIEDLADIPEAAANATLTMMELQDPITQQTAVFISQEKLSHIFTTESISLDEFIGEWYRQMQGWTLNKVAVQPVNAPKSEPIPGIIFTLPSQTQQKFVQ